ncbi:MAG: lipoprotein [Rickettsiales endosymbiont of Dermacentor nuttalli]
MSIINKIIIGYRYVLLVLLCIGVILLYGCAVRGPLTLPPEDITSVSKIKKNQQNK